MPHGASQGAAAANDLAEQQERSSVQMRNKSKMPQSKSKGQFTGYGGDAPLQTSEAKQQQRPMYSNSKAPPLHPWLEYPPNFKRACARNAMVSVARTPSPLVTLFPTRARAKRSPSRLPSPENEKMHKNKKEEKPPKQDPRNFSLSRRHETFLSTKG